MGTLIASLVFFAILALIAFLTRKWCRLRSYSVDTLLSQP
ncbi:MAG: hypothetical protein KatS3mg011_0531 [Acidimicrobiia bacterium]|nr:MAG: hypothetical protein KatS3mg011_0531 [Acidimicrobiia bacterium]